MFNRSAVTRDLASRNEQFQVKAKKVRFACPHCRKRFKDHLQRSAYSPFPTCRRCGTPVGEKHRVAAFDRTKKYGWLALKWSSCPVWGPLLGKYYAAKWSLRKVCRISGKLGAIVKLPIKAGIHVLSWWKSRRFASPEELMAYMKEAGYEHMVGSDELERQAPQLNRVGQKADALPIVDEPRDPASERMQVSLSHVGTSKYPDSPDNPHGLGGSVIGSKQIRNDHGALKLNYEVVWDNGEKGMYEAEDLSEV